MASKRPWWFQNRSPADDDSSSDESSQSSESSSTEGYVTDEESPLRPPAGSDDDGYVTPANSFALFSRCPCLKCHNRHQQELTRHEMKKKDFPPVVPFILPDLTVEDEKARLKREQEEIELAKLEELKMDEELMEVIRNM